MDDLISRAAAIEALYDERVDRYYGDVSPESVERLIESIPAVPAVPVVRCKDCKFWEEQTINDKPGGFGICSNIGGCWDGNEFCSDGERRET